VTEGSNATSLVYQSQKPSTPTKAVAQACFKASQTAPAGIASMPVIESICDDCISIRHLSQREPVHSLACCTKKQSTATGWPQLATFPCLAFADREPSCRCLSTPQHPNACATAVRAPRLPSSM
jgi:hypothetical protein